MWQLINSTPFAAGSFIPVDKTGERRWGVVIKATYRIAPDGELSLAEQQLPPEHAPKYRGEPGASSLIYEQDFAADKPRTDLYLNATAYAPYGQPSAEVAVGLKTPLGTKVLIVKGDREWRAAGGWLETTSARPFTSMPITYERTFGGYDRGDPDPLRHRQDPRNPVGTGFFTQDAHRNGKLLPNVGVSQGDADRPAGFGALCSYWAPRIDHQGTYDQAWIDNQKPLLPLDYDPQCQQSAPADQQFSPRLRGGEPIELLNLTPNGRLAFTLPRHYFVFTTAIGSRRHEHRAHLDTVVIEPDDSRLIMTWVSTLSCHHELDYIDYTRIGEKQYV